MGTVAQRLAELGLALPGAAAPVFNYVPFVKTGGLVFVAGQIPSWEGDVRYKGRLGATLSLEDGQAAARLCALNVLAQVQAACDGDLDRVERFVRLGAFVCCTPDFVDSPKVANGASDLLVAVFGDAGRHARTSVGTSSLPLGVSVEIDAIVAVR